MFIEITKELFYEIISLHNLTISNNHFMMHHCIYDNEKGEKCATSGSSSWGDSETKYWVNENYINNNKITIEGINGFLIR